MKAPIRQEVGIAALAERQMRQWALGDEVAERIWRADRPHQPAQAIHPCICISQQEGTDGSLVAQLVAERLGWPVLDKNLLDELAECRKLARDRLERVDETEPHWLFDALGPFLDRHTITHQRYVCCLSQLILLHARQESAVIVGRGAQFILPANKRLAVRLVAPLECRVKRVCQQLAVSPQKALRHIRRRDDERRRFVAYYFRRNIEDPTNYDLVVNMARFSPEEAAGMIVDIFCHHHQKYGC